MRANRLLSVTPAQRNGRVRSAGGASDIPEVVCTGGRRITALTAKPGASQLLALLSRCSAARIDSTPLNTAQSLTQRNVGTPPTTYPPCRSQPTTAGLLRPEETPAKVRSSKRCHPGSRSGYGGSLMGRILFACLFVLVAVPTYAQTHTVFIAPTPGELRGLYRGGNCEEAGACHGGDAT